MIHYMIQKMKRLSLESWLAQALCLVNALLLVALLNTAAFPLRVSCISGDSMNPTLQDGQWYVVTGCSQAQAGDIVIADSDAFRTYIVKRVIAVPGDTVAIVNGKVYRNGKVLQEDYIPERMVTKNIPPFTLKEGMYFLMGDNRNNSADSRVVGPVSQEEIKYVLSQDKQIFLWPLAAGWLLCSAMAVTYFTDWEAYFLARWLEKRGVGAKQAAAQA